MAATGLFGLLAYFVAQRSYEVGVRIAVGARPSEVVWLVARRGAWLAGLGILAGLGGTLALTRTIGGFLFQVSPTDASVLALVSIGIFLVAVLACVVPAWRAASVDPVAVLRQG